MNIEIVAFYPYAIEREEENILTGSMHIRLIDLGIDLRGIYCIRSQDSWSFRLPTHKGINSEGIKILYPVMSFIDRDRTKALLEVIKEKGKIFIETQLNAANQTKPAEPTKEIPAPQQSAPKQKVWVTPPPIKNRKKTAAKR